MNIGTSSVKSLSVLRRFLLSLITLDKKLYITARKDELASHCILNKIQYIRNTLKRYFITAASSVTRTYRAVPLEECVDGSAGVFAQSKE